MKDLFLILLAGLIVFGAGLPFVIAYSTGKKEMKEKEKKK